MKNVPSSPRASVVETMPTSRAAFKMGSPGAYDLHFIARACWLWRTFTASINKKAAAVFKLQRLMTGGVDGTRTRDPRRDRPVF